MLKHLEAIIVQTEAHVHRLITNTGAREATPRVFSRHGITPRTTNDACCRYRHRFAGACIVHCQPTSLAKNSNSANCYHHTVFQYDGPLIIAARSLVQEEEVQAKMCTLVMAQCQDSLMCRYDEMLETSRSQIRKPKAHTTLGH